MEQGIWDAMLFGGLAMVTQYLPWYWGIPIATTIIIIASIQLEFNLLLVIGFLIIGTAIWSYHYTRQKMVGLTSRQREWLWIPTVICTAILILYLLIHYQGTINSPPLPTTTPTPQ